MFNSSNFGLLGLMVLQQAIVCTVVLMAGYFVFRGVFRGLETASAAAKRRTKLVRQPTLPATIGCDAQTEELVLQS